MRTTNKISLVVLVVVLIQLLSCRSREDIPKDAGDPFYRFIENTFPEMETESAGFVNQPVEAESYQLAVILGRGHLLAADRVNQSILLFDREGTTLLSSIGREGKGPAEFNVISQLHIGGDNALYVLDILLRRITEIKIENNKLHYVTTYNIEPKQNISLRELYVTKHRKYGVFHRTDNYETMEESFHLYRMDGHFTPEKHLFELPGDEKLKLADNLYISHFAGRNIYWDMEGEWFYYISSKSPVVNKYNIRTGRTEKKQYFTLGERSNTRQSTDILKDQMASLIERYPAAEGAIEDTDTLPMFDNFQVYGNRMLFDVDYAGGKGGRIIHVDRATGDVHYIRTPFYSWRFALGEGILFSIETADEKESKNTIRMLKLKL